MKELEQLKFLNLKIQEATSKSVAITEKLVTTNKTNDQFLSKRPESQTDRQTTIIS